MGDAFHKVLEILMKDYASGALTEHINSLLEQTDGVKSDEATAATAKLVKHYEQLYKATAKRSRDRHDPAYIEQYIWMIDRAIQDTRWWIVPGKTPMGSDWMTEQSLAVQISNPEGEDFQFTSKIDILNGEFSPYDYKTSSALYNRADVGSLLKGKGYQLGTQALTVFEYYGKLPKRTGFVVFPKKRNLDIQSLSVAGITERDMVNVKRRMCWIVNMLAWHKKVDRWPTIGLEGGSPDCMFCQFKKECGR
jgi:hypothetical protein